MMYVNKTPCTDTGSLSPHSVIISMEFLDSPSPIVVKGGEMGGLCFSLDIPLIYIPTLDLLANKLEGNKGFIVSMLDARRMEVYSAIYDAEVISVLTRHCTCQCFATKNI